MTTKQLRTARPEASRDTPAPTNRLALAALVLVAAYAALRCYWQLGHQPARLSPIGTDLVAVTGWGAVGLCVAAALTALALLTARPTGVGRRLLLGAAAVLSAALVVSGALLLLDVVGGILPGLGLSFFPLGALSRAACVGSGVLLGLAARSSLRRSRAACGRCGRTGAWTRLAHTPGWAFLAAYLGIAGCLVRIVAQLCVGFGNSPMARGTSAMLFEVGFVLGGTLLPLALVHGWGRVWPRWVLGLAGRRVPRLLVLGPAVAVSGGLVVYFGLMLVEMIGMRLRGENPFPPSGGLDLPEVFFWFAVPGYLLWGVGMAVAALAYARRTRPACRRCGRG
ncbi:hypothetical protein F0L68_09060 [Solihabitans fulvus]|uniref:Uncharacterized protein n=1 Tax=Solihabitans fulvus TaxID=1892852 RepID=A0A5B2XLZ8_9PSEU|nr:hypothetical protein [Solihabitans fulvus]KAA2263812.1 hypothetical protein F0L68_09060 [Solihabitans fulvus]